MKTTSLLVAASFGSAWSRAEEVGNDQPACLYPKDDTLASTSLGLVALAWNEAIKATIVLLPRREDSLAALYTYAILATILAIVVLTLLGR